MSEKTLDVVALGELLIDFTQGCVSDQGNVFFEACPGGGPCNVLAMMRKLGKTCAFIGKVGDNMFGSLLRRAVLDAGINADRLVMDTHVGTTLAFVLNNEDGFGTFLSTVIPEQI